MPLPILYSLRQCPYAMRARLGLLLAKQTVILRDIVMTNIPTEMFDASAKGEVPVLVLSNSSVIDESLDIMVWALNRNDPHNLLFADDAHVLPDILSFIHRYDDEFVAALKKYKAASRYHDSEEVNYRQECEIFIDELEQRLMENDFIMGANLSLTDYAILPFIRQFSRVDRKWFKQAAYPKLRYWLEQHYQNPLFSKAMKKFPQWLKTKEDVLFMSD